MPPAFVSSRRSSALKSTLLAGRLLLVPMLLSFALAPSVVLAAEDAVEGRRLFKRGQDLFVEGRYLEAAHTFEAGYAAAPRTAFLINIAHSYRRAGELEKAKTYYLKLLTLEPNTPQRAEVEANIKSIDDALMLTGATPPPEQPVAAPAAPEYEAPPPEPAPTVMQVEPTPTPAPEARDNRSVFRKGWFWGIVFTAAAGAAIVTYMLTRDSGCAQDACFTEMVPK